MSSLETLQTNKTAEVVIIGGGVIGLTIARALALRGVRDVMLIERGSLGAEASSAAGGILAPQAEADRADDFFELACQSRDLYASFAAALLSETGIDVELDDAGTLYLAFTDEDESEIENRYAWQTRAGLPVERMSAGEARLFEPQVAERLRAALRFPLDVHVDNRRLVTALIASNEALGVPLVTETNVESLSLKHDRVAGVVTANGFVSTRRVVVAGGAWSSLITTSGVADTESSGPLPRIRIAPVRGQMLCFEARPALARHVLYSPRGYLVPRRDGRLLAGSTSEHAGFSKQVTADGVHTILSHAIEIAPALGALPLLDSWAGLRPRAEDDLPVLGPTEIEGLSYATGHYRNGILLAPITGELIAGAILGNVVSPLLKTFSPQRFDLVRAT